MEQQSKSAREIKSIHFLTFPHVSEQDLLAAWELMRSLAWTLSQNGQQLEVTLGGFDKGHIHTHMGAVLENQRMVSPDDLFDVLYIPGGLGGGAASKDQRILDMIRSHHKEGRWVAANCSGVGILHRSGLLKGLEVSSTAILARRLPALGTAVMSPRLAWRIHGKERIFTSGGAGTVHPSTIALIWKLFGDEAARSQAAAWDSLPLHGNSLFSNDGPVMADAAASMEAVQTQFEMLFLPD